MLLVLRRETQEQQIQFSGQIGLAFQRAARTLEETLAQFSLTTFREMEETDQQLSLT